MFNNDIGEKPRPGSFVVLDIESVVMDTNAHQRFQESERFGPERGGRSRRGLRPEEDGAVAPRWVFRDVIAASAALLIPHEDGNLQVSRFETWSAAEKSERQIVAGIFDLLRSAPEGTRLLSWAGAWHDIPILKRAALSHGLTLPVDWRWIAWGGEGRVPHVDLCRILTGGAKIKLVHMAEYAAATNVPCKLSAAPFSVARLARSGDWSTVEEIVETDVITTALLGARWLKIHDRRAEAADIEVVIDRLIRQFVEMRPNRRYVRKLADYRAQSMHARMLAARRAAAVLAPWLDVANDRKQVGEGSAKTAAA